MTQEQPARLNNERVRAFIKDLKTLCHRRGIYITQKKGREIFLSDDYEDEMCISTTMAQDGCKLIFLEIQKPKQKF